MLIGGKGTGDIRSGEERAQYIVDFTINPDFKAKPVKEDRTADEIAEGSGYTFSKGENDKYTFILTDSDGNGHKTETDEMPATIQDKNGNIYEVDEKGNLSPASNASTAVVSKLPLYVGVARNEGQQLPSAFYMCNFNNIDRFEEIHEKVKTKNYETISVLRTGSLM